MAGLWLIGGTCVGHFPHWNHVDVVEANTIIETNACGQAHDECSTLRRTPPIYTHVRAVIFIYSFSAALHRLPSWMFAQLLGVGMAGMDTTETTWVSRRPLTCSLTMTAWPKHTQTLETPNTPTRESSVEETSWVSNSKVVVDKLPEMETDRLYFCDTLQGSYIQYVGNLVSLCF